MYGKWKIRTEMLIGDEAIAKLSSSSVAVFGLGGVGGYVVEALARAGIGRLLLIDYDTVSESNKNRQIIALDSTMGMKKTQAAKNRAGDINKEINAEIFDMFITPENISEILNLEQKIDFVVDAVDNVTAKIKIAEKCAELKIPLISSMGTGNKTDSFAFEIDDIKNTSICPLARVMRRELKKRGIDSLTVLYSREQPKKSSAESSEKPVPASIAFVPSVAGLHIAGYVIKRLCGR